MPRRIRLSCGAAATTPSFTTNTFDADASVSMPSRKQDRLGRARVGRDLAREHVAQERGGLDVALLPAEVARGHAGDAVFDLLARGRGERIATS